MSISVIKVDATEIIFERCFREILLYNIGFTLSASILMENFIILSYKIAYQNSIILLPLFPIFNFIIIQSLLSMNTFTSFLLFLKNQLQGILAVQFLHFLIRLSEYRISTVYFFSVYYSNLHYISLFCQLSIPLSFSTFNKIYMLSNT